MNYNDYKKIALLLSEPRRIVLTAHSNPDGDTIGSCLALYHFFNKLGHQAFVISPNPIPIYLQWLTDFEKILVYDNDIQLVKSCIAEAELIFAIDYNAFNRSGKALEEILEALTIPTVLIDHHPNPHEVFDAIISDTSASSTAELIFRFIEDLDQLQIIDNAIAESLYVGLLTDTGSFSFSINSDKPYKIAAFLFNIGIDIQYINQRVYGSFTESKLRLTGFAISQKLVVLPELRFAYIALSNEELIQFNHQIGDTEGLVNYGLGIENIVAAALLVEKEGKIRISFRSKGDFAVNDIAFKYFAGGGHKNAAGGDSFVSMQETIEKLHSILYLYKTEINAIKL